MNEQCAPVAPEGFKHCISLAGVQECPEAYLLAHLVYPEGAYVDTRECTECTCRPPVGSSCVSKLYLFGNETCDGMPTEVFSLNSVDGDCANLMVPGLALGSKKIDPVLYIKGSDSCQPSPTEPIGDVIADEAQAITVCCREPDIPN